jgi:hypothetical protein
MSDLVQRYLLLGLRLGRHVDGLVDAYYGPDELARGVEAEAPADPAALAHEAEALREETARLDDPQRARWLAAQLTGLETVARRLAGEELPYVEEVRRCYGVAPEPPTEDELADAHRRLDELVPGSGPLAERYREWRRSLEVPSEAVLPLFEAVSAELRARTLALFELPEGEAVELELVTDEPWRAFNYYLGGLRSRVVLNTDLPPRAPDFAVFTAHEIYPGHHTEGTLKEAALVRGRGYGEQAIFLVGTPQCLVAEGIAEVALEILGPEAEQACAAILAEHGCGYDVELARELRRVDEVVEGLYLTVDAMLNGGGASRAEALEVARRWALRTEEEIEKIADFVLDPAGRGYAVTYFAGKSLVETWTGGDPARFARLLTEQLTTADLLETS